MGYFVRKLEELPVSKVEGAHGGTGVLEVVQLLGNQEGVGFPGNPDDFESDVNFLHRLVLPQGTCIGMHKHVNSEEFYYIEKGNAVMIADGNEIHMPPHSVFMINPGSEHSFLNCQTEDVVALVMEVNLDNK